MFGFHQQDSDAAQALLKAHTDECQIRNQPAMTETRPPQGTANFTFHWLHCEDYAPIAQWINSAWAVIGESATVSPAEMWRRGWRYLGPVTNRPKSTYLDEAVTPKIRYGAAAEMIGVFREVDLTEVMHYLYLPVRFGASNIRLPKNVECLHPMIETAIREASSPYLYVYLSARKGWATPDNPLNRPGWHADGFGTNDMNFVWWAGPGTRFAIQPFENISDDHVVSLAQFERQVKPGSIYTPPERHLYAIGPDVVHATPLLTQGCMRQYVKISLSDHKYNLENNSHNYLFDYDWPLMPREAVRNNTHTAQRDYAEENR